MSSSVATAYLASLTLMSFAVAALLAGKSIVIIGRAIFAIVGFAFAIVGLAFACLLMAWLALEHYLAEITVAGAAHAFSNPIGFAPYATGLAMIAISVLWSRRVQRADLSPALAAPPAPMLAAPRALAATITDEADCAIKALVGLGYKRPDAKRAIAAAADDLGGGATTATLIRVGLKWLARA